MRHSSDPSSSTSIHLLELRRSPPPRNATTNKLKLPTPPLPTTSTATTISIPSPAAATNANETMEPDSTDDTSLAEAEQEKVRVFIRLKGGSIHTSGEMSRWPCLQIHPENDRAVVCRGRIFRYDGILDEYSGQAEVYHAVAEPLIPGLFEGKSCAVLCYGQTGSGKTYTMTGPPDITATAAAASREGPFNSLPRDTTEDGIAHRVCRSLFRQLADRKTAEDGTFEVSVSFLEIYCERVYDLLADQHRQQHRGKYSVLSGTHPTTRAQPTSPRNHLRPSSSNSDRSSASPSPSTVHHHRRGDACDISGGGGSTVTVHGVTINAVRNSAETLELLGRGTRQRATAATKCNPTSSRGHAVFIITVAGILPGGRSTHSQLYLCDLAGSEKTKKTGATGLRLAEGARINTSLLALRQVINGLANAAAAAAAADSGAISRHIPYRDSKLTRLLQNALGGSGRTAIVCTVNPAADEEEEAMSTLRFGTAAATVQNLVKANVQKRSAEEWQLLLLEARAEVRSLKGSLQLCQRELDRHQHNGRLLATATVTGIAAASATVNNNAVVAIPAFLTCPLSGNRLIDPVLAADGHTYERAYLLRHLAVHGPLSPTTGASLAHAEFTENRIIGQILATLPPPPRPARTINDLPDEVLLHILGFAGGIALATCARVCCRLQRLVDGEGWLWEQVIRRDYKKVALELPAFIDPRRGQSQAVDESGEELLGATTAKAFYRQMVVMFGRKPKSLRRRSLPKTLGTNLELMAYV